MDKALGGEGTEVIMRILKVATEINAQSFGSWKEQVLFLRQPVPLSVFTRHNKVYREYKIPIWYLKF